MQITGAQIRAARALLDLQMTEVWRRTGVSKPTMVRIERDDPVQDRTRAKVLALLESLGVEFIERGVRLREMGEAAAIAAVVADMPRWAPQSEAA